MHTLLFIHIRETVVVKEPATGSLTFCAWFNHLTPPPTNHLCCSILPFRFSFSIFSPFLPSSAPFHSAHTPYLVTPSLIFHSHPAAPRLIHKQHHSLQQQKPWVGGGGIHGGRVAPTDILTAAQWGLPDSQQQPIRVLKRGEGVERMELGGSGVLVCHSQSQPFVQRIKTVQREFWVCVRK